jgi:general secretion pathway protein D
MEFNNVNSSITFGKTGLTSLILSGVLLVLPACQAGSQTKGLANPFSRVFQTTTNTKTKDVGQADQSHKNETHKQEDTSQIFPGTDRRVGNPRYQSSKSAQGGYNVNFQDASLPEVIQTILGDLLEVPFILDPRVQGKVTAATGGAVDKRALLVLLETILGNNSARLIDKGDSYLISPAGEALSGGQTRLKSATSPGLGVTIMPLNYVSATNILALLENTISRPGALRADTARNLIMITGTASERENALAAITAFDVDWMAGMSTAIFHLRNASAADVISELELVMQTGQGGGLDGALKLQAMERINAILAVAPSKAVLERTKNWINRLDLGGPSDVSLRTYKIDNGKALETADLLQQLFGGSSSSRRSSAVSPGLAQRSASSAGSTAKRSPTRASASKGVRSRNSVGAVLGGGLTSAPRIIGDPINNTLVVLATPQGQRLVAQALREIDHPPAQVLIDMVIAEVTLNDVLRYGVQYFFETGSIFGIGNGPTGGGGQGGFSNGGSLSPTGTFPGFNFILNKGDSARFALDALDNITDLKVVSAPSVVVLDNQSAHLQVGDQVPIITRQSTDVINVNAPLVNSVEFKDTGVILDVTPRVSSTGMVTMEVKQEVSNVSATATTGNLTPTISKRVLESVISARSGQTIVLGGLISDSRQVGNKGLPILSGIPGIGNAFGSHETTTKRTELLVFLTPRIIDPDKGNKAILNELRERMTLISREAAKTSSAETEPASESK